MYIQLKNIFWKTDEYNQVSMLLLKSLYEVVGEKKMSSVFQIPGVSAA